MLALSLKLCYTISMNKGETISSLFINNCLSLIIMNQVQIHFKESAKNHLEDLGLKYHPLNEELHVFVDDVPYEVVDGIYQDPDEQLCEHYGIDYNQVNCIEAMY